MPAGASVRLDISSTCSQNEGAVNEGAAIVEEHLDRGGREAGGSSHVTEQRPVVQAQEWLQRQLLGKGLKWLWPRLQTEKTYAFESVTLLWYKSACSKPDQ
jgi:hypothetical protein